MTPDHRALEAHAGWTFADGLQLRGRLQSFRDALEGANPLDTETAGLSLAGPIRPGSEVHALLDAFVQTRSDRLGTVDSTTRHVAFDLATPLNEALLARAGAVWTGTEDALTSDLSVSRLWKLALDVSLAAAGWHGSVNPGVTYRVDTGATWADVLHPSLALSMSKGRHGLRFHHGWSRLNNRLPSAADSRLRQTSLYYDYSSGAHRYGLELNHYDRDPETGLGTEAWRIALLWRTNFDRPASPRPVAPVATSTPSSGIATPPDLLELAPGLGLRQASERLAAARFAPAYRLQGLSVYETRLLEGIPLRQRLVLVDDAGDLGTAAVIVDFDDPADPRGMARAYARTREALIRSYGAPHRHDETGDFTAGLAEDLRQGRFKRMLKWRTPEGWLRVGIPRHLDGQLRMEILHTATFHSPTRWGLEGLR